MAYIENMLKFSSCTSTLHACDITKSHSLFFFSLPQKMWKSFIICLKSSVCMQCLFWYLSKLIWQTVIVLDHRPTCASDWDVLFLVDAQQILISGLRRWEKIRKRMWLFCSWHWMHQVPSRNLRRTAWHYRAFFSSACLLVIKDSNLFPLVKIHELGEWS